MASRKHSRIRHGRHRGHPPKDNTTSYLEILLADLTDEHASAMVSAWCSRHAVTLEPKWAPGTASVRYLMLSSYRDRWLVDGHANLAELVGSQWPVLVSIDLGFHAGRKLQTLLSEADHAAFSRWLERSERPHWSGADQTPVVQDGVVLLDPIAGATFPLGRAFALMRTIGDALLEHCGIPASKRSLALEGDRPVRQVDAIAGALLEHAVGGVFCEDDANFTIFTGSYVLPVAEKHCLIRVAVSVADDDQGDLASAHRHEVEVDRVTFDWLGLDAAAAAPFQDAVAAALVKAGYVHGWNDPKVPDAPVPALFAWTARQFARHLTLVEDLTQATKRGARREEAHQSERKRDERRWHDREADLCAQRDVARAALERERAQARQRQVAKPDAAGNAVTPRGFDAESARRGSELELPCAGLQARVDDYVERVDALRQALHQAEAERDAALEGLGATPVSDRPPPKAPTTLAELGGWAHRALDGRVVVVPRALRSARKSNFDDPALVYRTLEAMRDAYWAMKFGQDAGAQEVWRRFLQTEHLTCSRTGTGPESRLADTYHVSWDGRRLPLDMHLQGNSGRHEARQFRLYFHADETSRRLIIGHLPSHLPNQAT